MEMWKIGSGVQAKVNYFFTIRTYRFMLPQMLSNISDISVHSRHGCQIGFFKTSLRSQSQHWTSEKEYVKKYVDKLLKFQQ